MASTFTIKAIALCMVLGITLEVAISVARLFFETADIILSLLFFITVLFPFAAFSVVKSTYNRVVGVVGFYGFVALIILLHLSVHPALFLIGVGFDPYDVSPAQEWLLFADVGNMEDLVYDLSLKPYITSIEVLPVSVMAASIFHIYGIIFASAIATPTLFWKVLLPICFLWYTLKICAKFLRFVTGTANNRTDDHGEH